MSKVAEEHSSASTDKCIITKDVICQLGSCVKSVNGIDSNSSSPSDTWIIEFNKYTVYMEEDGKEIQFRRAFLKVFIDPAFIWAWLADSGASVEMSEIWKYRLNALDGLMYESAFYKNIINPI